MASSSISSDSLNGLRSTSSIAIYTTKTDLVYQHLRGQIVSGQFAPGSRLYLDEIARGLGLSTNPVREALRRLQSEGLVTNRPHHGATVASIDPAKIDLHFQVRAVLEGLAIRLAASARTSAQLEHLTVLSRNLERLAEDGDLPGWDDRNLAFHQSLFECAQAPELVELIDLQRDRSPRYRHFPEALAQRVREANAARVAVLEAIQAGDGDRAELLHRANVIRAGQVLAAAMQKGSDEHERNLEPVEGWVGAPQSPGG